MIAFIKEGDYFIPIENSFLTGLVPNSTEIQLGWGFYLNFYLIKVRKEKNDIGFDFHNK